MPIHYGITVIDVMREMGRETDKRATWAIGLMCVNRYKSMNAGALPPKDLRTKISGEGAHCFAIYPQMFKGEIVRIIEQYGVEAARQRDLFECCES